MDFGTALVEAFQEWDSKTKSPGESWRRICEDPVREREDGWERTGGGVRCGPLGLAKSRVSTLFCSK